MEKTKNLHFIGIFQVALAALCWSSGGVFLKFTDANILFINAIRYAVGFLALVILNKSLPSLFIKENGIINKKATTIYWLGGISFAICSFTYVVANKYTTAANAIFLQYTNPIWITILGPFFLKEKNSTVDYLAIAGVFVGMICFFADEFAKGFANIDSKMMFGNAIAVFSGFFMACYTMLMRKQKNGNPLESSMLSQLIGFAVSCPALFMFSFPTSKTFLFLGLTGLINGALALYFYSQGVKKTPALSASLIGILEPLTNPLWVFIFAKEIPGKMCIIGGIIIICFVVFRTIYTELTATSTQTLKIQPAHQR